MKINSKELMLKSSEKLGRHIPEVKSGCGVQRSKKEYTRKQKHRKDWE